MAERNGGAAGRQRAAAPTSDFALGVDLGTGSARAFLFDMAGRRHGGVRLPYAWRVTPDGGVEAEADALVQLVEEAIDGAVSALPASGAQVVAVGVSGLWHTLLGIDADHRPVTPAYAWNDTRATDAARRLRGRLDGDALHARTGATLHPAYPAARLAWLRDAEPDAYRRARWWLSLPEYLWLRLTGELAVDVSIAAGSGLLDQTTLLWDRELLGALQLEPDRLPPLVTRDADIMRRGAADAERWPALRATPWRMPVGDGACACVGSGCTGPEHIALTIGTSAAVRVLRPWHAGAEAPPGLWMYRLDAGHALFGAASSNGGSVRQWLLRTLRLPEESTLDALLLARPPAAHGLAFLPFLAGERSPDWPLDATAVVAGVRLGTTPLDVLQAGMEAVAYRLALLCERLRAIVPEAATIIGSGTALERSPYWAQLVADAIGEPIRVCAEPEASSRGAALLALTGAGAIGSIEEVPAPASVRLEPDPDRHVLHRAARDRLAALENAHAME